MVRCCVCGHMDNNARSIVQVYCFSNCNFSSNSLVQPYKKKWLNICDTCLLFDLVFLTALLSDQNQTTSDTSILIEVMIYLLVMIPLCFISVGAIGIITVRTGLLSLVKRLYNWWKDKCTARQNNI